MAKKEKINPLGTFSGTVIDLTKFNLETDKKQFEIIEKTLKDIYKDELEVTKKHVNKVLSLTYNPKDDYTYLPYDLKVSKERLELKFYVEKKAIGIGWLIFGIWLLLFALIGSTYLGFRYIKIINVNKDIDGDGIADINIDINNDYVADINVDTSNDDKPNLNVDYKGNRRAVFNLDLDGDGEADSNLVNDASTPETAKSCKINCDVNGDGWPDLNLDLDGDGVPDIDIDADGDGVPDLNLDINGDCECDIMCDTNNDGKCDVNCIKDEYNGIGTGTSTHTGDQSASTSSATLIIRYVEGETINVDNLFPDDQPNLRPEERIKPMKTFTVENLSNYTMEYNILWKVDYNTFITDHLQYKITGTNGGFTKDYVPAPRVDGYIAQRITIPPRAVQKYTIEFNLIGTNQEQNEDQGKTFRGLVDIET